MKTLVVVPSFCFFFFAQLFLKNHSFVVMEFSDVLYYFFHEKIHFTLEFIMLAILTYVLLKRPKRSKGSKLTDRVKYYYYCCCFSFKYYYIMNFELKFLLKRTKKLFFLLFFKLFFVFVFWFLGSTRIN